MTPTDLEAVSLLRNALEWLEQGHPVLSAHFARKAVRVLAPEDEPKTVKPEHISRPLGRVLRMLKGKVGG